VAARSLPVAKRSGVKSGGEIIARNEARENTGPCRQGASFRAGVPTTHGLPGRCPGDWHITLPALATCTLEKQLHTVCSPGGNAGTKEVRVLRPDRAPENHGCRQYRPILDITPEESLPRHLFESRIRLHFYRLHHLGHCIQQGQALRDGDAVSPRLPVNAHAHLQRRHLGRRTQRHRRRSPIVIELAGPEPHG
jgi:hypothetical protein